jgi:predicted HicB family RNase H-like nuclease
MSLLKTGRPSVNKEKVLLKLEKGQDLTKMNLNIAKSFHKEVKRYALENDITITELIHKSLQEYMKK